MKLVKIAGDGLTRLLKKLRQHDFVDLAEEIDAFRMSSGRPSNVIPQNLYKNAARIVGIEDDAVRRWGDSAGRRAGAAEAGFAESIAMSRRGEGFPTVKTREGGTIRRMPKGTAYGRKVPKSEARAMRYGERDEGRALEEFGGIKQIAEKLGVSVEKVRQMIKSGQLGRRS
jgi:hypothetical protein